MLYQRSEFLTHTKLSFRVLISVVLVDIAGNVVISCVHLTVVSSEVGSLGNSNYTTSNYSAVNFVCNNNSYYLSDCSSLVTYNSVCQFHQDDAYLTCGIGMNYSSDNMHYTVCLHR